tara:strand:- start:194 stop:415 length:222 start_codon:yes stop_codon:yes gene_type:complete
MTQTKQEIIKKIKEEIPYIDIKPYSHNIIGLELSILEQVAGKEAVIELVKTTRLKNLGWHYILEQAGIKPEDC